MATSASNAILITGCSSGIGHAAAMRLVSQRRWTVYATARKLAAIADLEAAGCRTLALDVTDEASMTAAVERIEREHGSVAALVNNAGYSQSGAVEAVPLARVRAQFETNVFGLLRMTQLVLPGMRNARAGRIVNISSMGGTLVFPGGGIYHATKYAVEAISDALRFELRGFGVGVVVIQPGLIRTHFADAVSTGMPVPAAGDPYATFHGRVEQATRDAYTRGMAARLSSPPEAVAAAIERAIASPRPRARYVVSPSAHIFMALRWLLGDRGWDRFLRGAYPSPGEETR